MTEFKNMVGAQLRITFENDVITYLKKNEISLPFKNKIKKVEKYMLYSTLKTDTYYWETIYFEIDRSNCIREKPPPKYYNNHVFLV